MSPNKLEIGKNKEMWFDLFLQRYHKDKVAGWQFCYYRSQWVEKYLHHGISIFKGKFFKFIGFNQVAELVWFLK